MVPTRLSVFTCDSDPRERDQLQRVLSQYDLDSWIFTSEVDVEAGAEPDSMPVLTLNLQFLDADEMPLSLFLHEQARWFVVASTFEFLIGQKAH